MSDHQHTTASPAPAGLVGLAIACFTFFASLTGRVGPEANLVMGLWLLGGFFIQYYVAIGEYNHGALTGGNVFLFFSGYFMFVGGMEHIVNYFAMLKDWPLDGRISGWAWVVLSVALISWTPAYLKESNKAMSLLVLVVDVATIFVFLIDLQVIPATMAPIPGWLLLISGILGLYVAAGIILNGAFGREIVKLGKPFLE